MSGFQIITGPELAPVPLPVVDNDILAIWRDGAALQVAISDVLSVNSIVGINITNPSVGDTMMFDGTNWVNNTPTVVNLGSLPTSVTLDVENKRESYFMGTLGSSETTFTLANVPAGVAAISLDLNTGPAVTPPIWTDASPAPVLEVDRMYRIIFTPKHAGSGYWIQYGELN